MWLQVSMVGLLWPRREEGKPVSEVIGHRLPKVQAPCKTQAVLGLEHRTGQGCP